MALSPEVGLRLLLSPFGSNVVIRTACCTMGTVLPVYSTFKAIESKDRDDQQKWLLYWTVYGSFSVAEAFTDKLISWIPLYYHVKFAFLVWLQLPSANGARQLYMSKLRPFLLRHQARLDQVVEIVYREINKFINSHNTEIQFARSLFMKVMAAVNQTVSRILHPLPTQANRAIDGPRGQNLDAKSDHEE